MGAFFFFCRAAQLKGATGRPVLFPGNKRDADTEKLVTAVEELSLGEAPTINFWIVKKFID